MIRSRGPALLAISALAVFFRLYQITTIPPGLFIDEAQDGLDAYAIQQGEHFPVYVEGAGGLKERGREPLFFYLMAGVFSVLGPTVTSIRVTSALIGIATVITFFLLCERVYGLRVACIAGVLLAVCRWHVTFSRIGMRAVAMPLLMALALLAFHALTTRRTTRAALVFGATLGLGFYTYPPFWIVPLLLGGLLVLGMQQVRSAGRGTLLPLALAVAGAFVCVTGPLLLYAFHRPDQFFARAVEVARAPDALAGTNFSLRDNAQKVLFMLHFRGDQQPRHNIPGRPLLDPVMGAAFLVGLFVLLKTIRIDPLPKVGMLSFWVFPLLPSVVTEGAPHAMRTLGAVLAVCLICAVGMDALTQLVAHNQTLRRWRVPGALLLAMLAAVTALNYHAYFDEWGRSEVVAQHFSADIPRFFTYCADLADQSDVYLCPYVFYAPNTRFLNLRRRAPWKLLQDDTAFTLDGGRDRDRVFVCDSPAVNWLIDKLYPEREVLGHYATWEAHTGRIVRVGGKELRPSLPANERAEITYWIGKALASFQQQTRAW